MCHEDKVLDVITMIMLMLFSLLLAFLTVLFVSFLFSVLASLGAGPVVAILVIAGMYFLYFWKTK